MMRETTLIDITRLLSRALEGKLPTGVDRVGLAYIAHYGAGARSLVRFGGRWLVQDEGASRQLFQAVQAPGPDLRRLVRLCVGSSYALNWRAPGAARLFNVVHSGLEHPGYGDEIRRRGWRAFFFLHDLIPLTHPEYCRPGEAEKHRRRLQTMLSAGEGIIVNSSETRTALENFAQKQGLRPPPCAVAPLAPARLPSPADLRPLSGPYFVTLGTIEARKNHLMLLHIWRRLAEELGAGAPKLVVIGQRGWESEQAADLLDRCEALKTVVIEKRRCDDAELATWLHHARALLFPSFAEGFGIPLVEALVAGLPVIASDLPVFREIAGSIPAYLDPLDGLGWRRMILDYTPTGSTPHRAQRERMKGYAPPSWDSHFATVDAFLNGLRRAA